MNWKALEGAGVTRDAQINMHLTGITLRKAMEMVLTEASGGDTLSYVVDQGVIEITTRDLADHMMVTRVYPVEDLLMVIPDFTDAPQFSLDASQNQGTRAAAVAAVLPAASARVGLPINCSTALGIPAPIHSR